MSKESEILALILGRLKGIQDFPIGSPGGVLTEFPSWISAGDGKSLIVNREIGKLIADLANGLYAKKPMLSNSISAKDWLSLVTRVVGPILAAIDLENPIQMAANKALAELNKELDDTDWNFHKRTFLFGCSFIQRHEIPPFTVGPVTIRRRETWLDHFLEQGRITPVTHRRLKARWSGKKLRPRKRSPERFAEEDIIEAVGEAPFICSVETDGLFGEVAKEKALLAARLTLLGVALMWASPRKALEDINLVYDGPPYRQVYNFYQERSDMLGGSRWVNSLYGISLFKEAWEPLIAKHSDWWTILSETIRFLLGHPDRTSRPKLMNSFAHALIWFHEACREPMPIIAITKFMSCLDALACGRMASGITALVSRQIGVEPDAPIREDGPSFKKAIDDLYSQGRSRLLHGNSDRLGHDWEDQRGLAETLARLCLIACFHWAVEHPTCSDPRQMALPD
ncbi:hypothetical protein [Sphingomonas panacis]|uniref:hypothetical protein n=1 Tax=Sphingomonas panacis TaxID=1560345 RepID=UPI001237166C|nr:hypothetical protein [Sphingomonas panacis]